MAVAAGAAAPSVVAVAVGLSAGFFSFFLKMFLKVFFSLSIASGAVLSGQLLDSMGRRSPYHGALTNTWHYWTLRHAAAIPKEFRVLSSYVAQQ